MPTSIKDLLIWGPDCRLITFQKSVSLNSVTPEINKHAAYTFAEKLNVKDFSPGIRVIIIKQIISFSLGKRSAGIDFYSLCREVAEGYQDTQNTKKYAGQTSKVSLFLQYVSRCYEFHIFQEGTIVQK